MNIVRDGNDYEPQPVSAWRLRELLQHERDNAQLRLDLAAAESRLTEARQQLDRLTSELSHEANARAKAQIELAEAEQQRESTRNELLRRNTQLAEVMGQFDELDSENESLQTQLTQALALIKGYQAKLSADADLLHVLAAESAPKG